MIDVASDPAYKDEMRQRCGDETALAPQIFSGDYHCGVSTLVITATFTTSRLVIIDIFTATRVHFSSLTIDHGSGTLVVTYIFTAAQEHLIIVVIYSIAAAVVHLSSLTFSLWLSTLVTMP